MLANSIYFMFFYALLQVIPVAVGSAAAPTCYHFDGTPMISRYQPCNITTTDPSLSKVCCNLANGDICLPNGVCQTRAAKPTFWRNGCTQKDWNDGGCPDLCLEFSGNQTQVTPCGDPKSAQFWCCGDDDSCCTGNHFRRQTVAPEFNLETQNPGSGLSSNAKAGIGVAAGLCVAALVGLSIFVVKAWRWRTRAKSAPLHDDVIEYQAATRFRPVQLPGGESQVYEMEHSKTHSQAIAELDAHSQPITELDGPFASTIPPNPSYNGTQSDIRGP